MNKISTIRDFINWIMVECSDADNIYKCELKTLNYEYDDTYIILSVTITHNRTIIYEDRVTYSVYNKATELEHKQYAMLRKAIVTLLKKTLPYDEQEEYSDDLEYMIQNTPPTNIEYSDLSVLLDNQEAWREQQRTRNQYEPSFFRQFISKIKEYFYGI